MGENFGPGLIGGVVLLDPSTGQPYKATGGGTGGGTADWTTLANKPAVVAAGATQGAARTAIDAEPAGTAAGLVGALTKTSVGLANVDNTSDVNKPVSTAQASAIAVVSNQVTRDTAAFAYGAFATTTTGDIIDPTGNKFLPIGVHIAVPSMGDNGDALTRSDDLINVWSRKDPAGNIISSPNTVYLDCGVVTDAALPAWWPANARNGNVAYNGETLPQWKVDIIQRINEYTAAGLVVVVVSRDSMNATGSLSYIATDPQITNFFVWLVGRYKNNPYVWVNPHCEPPKTDQTWCDMHNLVIDGVRNAGYVGPIIVDPPTAGQDVGSEYLTFNPNGSTWIQLVNASGTAVVTGITNKSNLVNGVHWYGWPTWQRSTTGAINYVNTHKAAGFPVVLGEMGCITVNTGTAVDAVGSDREKATHVAFDLIRGKIAGGIWWHGHHGDGFYLVSGTGSTGQFWTMTSGNILWTGQKLLDSIGAQI
jgi:hypothetical protein